MKVNNLSEKGCGCGSNRTVTAKQKFAQAPISSKPLNKVYKTKTSIFN
jgi:hypothetical protein